MYEHVVVFAKKMVKKKMADRVRKIFINFIYLVETQKNLPSILLKLKKKMFVLLLTDGNMEKKEKRFS